MRKRESATVWSSFKNHLDIIGETQPHLSIEPVANLINKQEIAVHSLATHTHVADIQDPKFYPVVEATTEITLSNSKEESHLPVLDNESLFDKNSNLAWYRGHVNILYKTNDWLNLPYVRQPVTSEDSNKWRGLGYNHQHFTGQMYDSTNPMPDWVNPLAEEIGLSSCGFVFYKMETGVIMPTHVDHFSRYCELFKVKRSQIWRAIVFLDDWKPGHYFEINGEPIVNYIRGDYVVWSADTPHAASNIGVDARYTLQITGINYKPKKPNHYHGLFWHNLPSQGNEQRSWLGFMQRRLLECTYMGKNIKTFFIWTGTGRIKQLEEFELTQQQIDNLPDNEIHIYLYEPMTCYINELNRGYYHEFSYPIELDRIKSLELDSIAVFAKRYAGKFGVKVYTGDKGAQILSKNYSTLKIGCKDVFLRIESVRTYPWWHREITKKFWCANWRWTVHRHLIMAYLSACDGTYSWHLQCKWPVLLGNGWIDLEALRISDKPRYKRLRQGTDAINSQVYKIDHGNLYSKVESTHTCVIPNQGAPDSDSRSFYESYADTFCAVITESRFASPFGNFSEKTFAPIGMLKPFILVAPYATLQYLKEFGFRTWDQWWDESYDLEADPAKRLLKIFDIIDYIDSKSIEELREMYQQMRPILEHNQKILGTIAWNDDDM